MECFLLFLYSIINIENMHWSEWQSQAWDKKNRRGNKERHHLFFGLLFFCATALNILFTYIDMRSVLKKNLLLLKRCDKWSSPPPMSKTKGSLRYGATVTEPKSHRTHIIFIQLCKLSMFPHTKPLLHVVDMHVVYSSRRGLMVRSETETGFTARSWWRISPYILVHTGGVVSWYRSVHTGQLCPGVKLWNTSELSDGWIVLRSSICCGYHSGLALGLSNRMQCMY